MSAGVLVLPAHASHSQVATWSRCGRQYLLERVMRVETQPQGALIGGSAVHDAIEAHLSNDADPKVAFAELFTAAVDEAGGAAKVRWSGRKSRAYPNGEDPSWWMVEAPKMLDRALALLAAIRDSGGEIVSHEAQYQFEVDGKPVVAKPDLVVAYPDGPWSVIDWKTSSQPSLNNPTQVSLYCVAAAGVHGLEVEQCIGQVAMLRKDGAEGLITYNPALYIELALQMVRDFVAGTEAGVFAMSPSTFNCVPCQVKAECAFGRTLITSGGEE